MIHQLQAPEEVITPLGEGWARYVWEAPSQLWWGVVQKDTGEMWWWDNHLIRLDINITEKRYKTSPIHIRPELEEALAPHRKRYPKK